MQHCLPVLVNQKNVGKYSAPLPGEVMISKGNKGFHRLNSKKDKSYITFAIFMLELFASEFLGMLIFNKLVIKLKNKCFPF